MGFPQMFELNLSLLKRLLVLLNLAYFFQLLNCKEIREMT